MEKTTDQKNHLSISSNNSKLDFFYNLANKLHKFFFKEQINPCGPFTKKYNTKKYVEYTNLNLEPIENVLPLRDSRGRIYSDGHVNWPIIEAKYTVSHFYNDECQNYLIYKEKGVNQYFLVYRKCIESGILPFFKMTLNHSFIANSPEEAIEEARIFLRKEVL